LKENNKKNFTSDKTFGGRLHKIRKDKGLSQKELANKLGYKQSGSISNIENDKTPPDIQVLQNIANVLPVDLHWLITGEVSPTTYAVAERYITLTEKLAPYVGHSMAIFLEERTKTIEAHKQAVSANSDPVEIARLKKIIDKSEARFQEYCQVLDLLQESPFGGNSYEEKPDK